ncbi:MAG: FecR family protein [Myxococcota bacterium]|jgi:hypothetical protein|nr:FecR family protein [Myxococcota bacterium]
MDDRSLAARIASAQDEAGARMGARTAVAARIAYPTRRDRSLPAGVLLMAVAAATLVVLWSRQTDETPSVTFDVDGRAAVAGEWIAPDLVSERLSFSDGSTVRLDPRAAVRVRTLEPEGAALVLERGRVELDVRKRPGARWTVEAGPYVVSALGTRFVVRWEPAARELEVAVAHGRVSVRHRDGREAVLGAAEQLRATSDGIWRVEPERDDAPSTPIEVEAPPSAPPIEARPAPPRRAPVARPSPTPSWRSLADEGRFADALARAEAEGFERILERASADDLLALSTAARLGGSTARAIDGCDALRRRFPGTRQSTVAAFQRGRLAFDREHDPRSAARWMAIYLTEEPDGELARDARGRRLEALRTAGLDDEARDAAREYLAHHPEGPHAAMARQTLAR